MESPVSPNTQFRINVAGFLSVIAAVFASAFMSAMWVGDKLNTLAALVSSDRAQTEAIDKLKQEILVNREETLKNREINQRILDQVK